MDDIEAAKSILGDSSSGQNDDLSAAASIIGTPTNVSKAQEYIGQPIDQGYCETFAEHVSGLPNMGGSAAEAFNNFSQQGKANPNINEAPAGSLIYFSPDQSNGNFGHVGVSDGQGGMISAGYNGVQQTPIDQWIQQTGQKPMGFVNLN